DGSDADSARSVMQFAWLGRCAARNRSVNRRREPAVDGTTTTVEHHLDRVTEVLEQVEIYAAPETADDPQPKELLRHLATDTQTVEDDTRGVDDLGQIEDDRRRATGRSASCLLEAVRRHQPDHLLEL